MKGTIKTNGKYTAVKIIGITVFTYEGAVEAYKKCVARFSEDLTPEASSVLSEAADQLQKLGFSLEEIEQFEIDAIA